MRKLRVSIDTASEAVKAFKLLKTFDPTFELGPTLAKLRSVQPVIDVHAYGPGSIELLQRIIKLFVDLNGASLKYRLEITDGEPDESTGRPIWPTRLGELQDLEIALDEEIAAQKHAEELAASRRAWAESPAGQEYVRMRDRLRVNRELLEERWDALGLDGLNDYEQDYVHVWCFYVETSNGTLHQYFYNSAGDTALQTIDALERAGAVEARRILSEALGVFDSVGGFSADRSSRQESLEALSENAFDALTHQFYDLPDNICDLALERVAQGYRNDGIGAQTPITEP